MASTYSSRLRIELIGTGEQSGIWGDTTNTNLGTLIEEAIAGVATITMTDANYTLSEADGATDESRQAVLVLTGTLSAGRNVIAPAEQKVYIVKNSTTGGFATTIKTSAGTGYAVGNGKTVLVYCDGTDFHLAADVTSTVNPTFTGNISLDGPTVVNDSGADSDFRVEGDTDANLIFADASTDRVGIGTNTPSVKFDVNGDSSLNGAVVINEAGADKDFRVEGDTDANLIVADASTDRVGIGTATPSVKLDVSGDTSLDGAVVINEAGADKDFRVEGDTDSNLILADASADAVGIGTATPGSKLDVKGTLRLSGSSSGYVGLAPAAAAGSTTYTFPSSDGSNGQVLSTNGSGDLSWASVATPSAFPSGTVMLFGQTSAPTGWTKDTTNYNNSALRVVTGTVSSGGTSDFTTVFASRTPSGSVSSSFSSGSTSSVTATGSVSVSGGSVGATTLATTQIPSHTHTVNFANSGIAATAGANQFGAASANNSGATGGGGSHTHSFTTPTATFTGTAHSHSVSGTVSSSFTGTAMDFAVKYVDVIRATKD